MSSGKKKKPVNIAADTNIYISCFMFPGDTTRMFFDMVYDGHIRLGISEDIIKEFIKVGIFKFKYDPEKTIAMSNEIRKHSSIVSPSHRASACKHEPDNRILECAVEFGADLIVSGDRHLLELKKYRGIEIATPGEAVKRILNGRG
jgi:uncharacterized protein